ncbi:MAG: hypothetical protein JW820_12915 [Spirochaetales bacterium]|nr:hypothetical protein [Spirochaetales bacterium]
MNRSSRVLVVVILLLAIATTNVAAQGVGKNPVPAYFLTWLVGFGTGHFYMQDDAAVRFLLLDAVSYLATLGGLGYAYYALYADVYADPYSTEMPTGALVGLGVGIVGSLVYTAVRIWEIVDIFQVADARQSGGKAAVRPMLEIGPEGTTAGVAFSY